MYIKKNKIIPLFSTTTFTEHTEKLLINNLIELMPNLPLEAQRKLASYPFAKEEEKNILILELMDCFWNASNKSTISFPDVNKIFSVFRDFDRIFAILEKRGHFIHQFEVFLLGSCLIRLLFSNATIKEKFDFDTFFYGWLIVSTAHDFGYPLQIASEMASKFSKLYKKLHMSALSLAFEFIEKQCSYINEKDLLSVEIYDAISKNKCIYIDDLIKHGLHKTLSNEETANKILSLLKRENNHGYVSALIFCRNYIEYLSCQKDSEFKDCFENTIVDLVAAIAIHSLPKSEIKIINSIDFYENPLAYILILMDNLQDWNRQMRPSSDWPSYNLMEFNFNSNVINIGYNLRHNNWTKRMENQVKESLNDKRQLLNQLPKIKPTLNIKILVRFITNHRLNIKGIKLQI